MRQSHQPERTASVVASSAVKKKLAKPRVVSSAKLKRMADETMESFKKEATARYEKANKLYEQQDEATRDALDRMTALLCRIARKNMWIGVKGYENRAVLQIPEETIYHNMFYMACEIIKDLAQFDIQVAGFKFPENLCAVCYTDKVAKPRKKRR